MRQPGMCEQLITTTLRHELADIPNARKSVAPIDKAETAEVLSRYVAKVACTVLERIQESKMDVQVMLVNRMMKLLTEDSELSLVVDEKTGQMLALMKEKDSMLVSGKRLSDMMCIAVFLLALSKNRRCSTN